MILEEILSLRMRVTHFAFGSIMGVITPYKGFRFWSYRINSSR